MVATRVSPFIKGVDAIANLATSGAIQFALRGGIDEKRLGVETIEAMRRHGVDPYHANPPRWLDISLLNSEQLRRFRNEQSAHDGSRGGFLTSPGFLSGWEFARDARPLPRLATTVRVPLVEGEAVTPLVRLATLCDFASGAGNALDFTRFTSINPDLSLHVLREPRGEWIGIAAQSEIEADGVGQSHATLFDAEGAVARALVSLLVERRPR